MSARQMPNTDVTPRMGPTQWAGRPTDVDCLRCWPRSGYGHRPTRKGKQAFNDAVQLTMRDVKGECFHCAGTGLLPIPLREVMRDPEWTNEDAARWQRNK